MQRPRTRGATAAGEMKRRATQQSSRRQTVMMAHHFTAGRCADALIPTLGLDASTPAAPFKCSLLDALDTSPTSSSTTSSSNTSPSDGSFCLLRRRRNATGAPRAAGTRRRFPSCGRPEPEAPCVLGHRRRTRRTTPPRDLHRLDPSGSCTRRCSECAIAGGASDGGSPPHGKHRSGAPGGGGRPWPPPPGCGRVGATGGGTPCDRSGRDSPPPGGGDAGTPHRAGVLILGAPRRH
jgi:hypothetical protein